MIRKADENDLPSMAALHAASFAEAWSDTNLRELMASAGAVGLIEQGRGFILCRSIAGEAEILTLAVHPDHRRAGLGTALLRSAGDFLAAAGAEALFLEVERDNPGALALYRSAGFRQVGERTGYYARPNDPIDALVLRLDLNR